MAKRGPKPKGKVKIEWSSNFAYAIGLLASDGCVSSNNRHISFVSKDLEQVKNFIKCLRITNKIGRSLSGNKKSYAYRVQFGDVNFVEFLKTIGIGPVKSKIMGILAIPNPFFLDFLRGSFDGDGCIYSYWDPRWKSSFMFYVTFVSASKVHIDWIRTQIFYHIKSQGHVTKPNGESTYQLRYAKKDSINILRKMFYTKSVISLKRKRLKIKRILAIVGESL